VPFCSALYPGRLFHRRLAPVAHAFAYPALFGGFRLAELDALSASVAGFGHNRRAPLAIWDRDYLDAGPEPLRERLQRRLDPAGLRVDPARTLLFTAPRYFGYVFNPVSFWFGLAPDETPLWALAEVNNTFRDRHAYLLPRLERDGEDWVAARDKDFHVSPFSDRQGEYRFRFHLAPDRVRFRVDLHREGRLWLEAVLEGTPRPLTARTVWRTLATHPLTLALTFPRIVVQAAALKFRHRLPWHPRPPATSPDTLRRRED
jgi:cyclopropane-fatty-acyl-phospholipid synthase